MLGGVAEGSREDRGKRYGPTQNAAMRCRPETPKTKRCAVARKGAMRCRFAARTGHGGNKELRQLLREEVIDYAKKIQFSLVEVCDINASDEYILSRESHWKDVLLTREFGLNWN